MVLYRHGAHTHTHSLTHSHIHNSIELLVEGGVWGCTASVVLLRMSYSTIHARWISYRVICMYENRVLCTGLYCTDKRWHSEGVDTLAFALRGPVDRFCWSTAALVVADETSAGRRSSRNQAHVLYTHLHTQYMACTPPPP